MKYLSFVFASLLLIGQGCVSVNVNIPAPEGPQDVQTDPTNQQVQEVPPVVQSANIRVFEPVNAATVGCPGVTVRGEARVFENTVSWRLVDVTEGTTTSGFTTANAPDIGQFGPFEFVAPLPNVDAPAGLRLEVFQTSAMDGSEIDKVTVNMVTYATSPCPAQ